MTTKTRRAFTAEFKREAVGLLEGSGKPVMQVAAELGISPSMLRNWRRAGRGVVVRERRGEGRCRWRRSHRRRTRRRRSRG